MRNIYFLSVLAILSMILTSCFVTTTKYDDKVRESDVLRESLSECKRKNNVLTSKIEEITITVDSLNRSLTSIKDEKVEREEEVERLKDMLDELEKTYGASKISRETLINELLEKEKKYSGMINELNVKNSRLDDELDAVKSDLEKAENKNVSLTSQIEEAGKAKTDLDAKIIEIEKLNSDLSGAQSLVLLLEGRIARLKEEVDEFLPLSSVKQKSIGALSGNTISTFFSREISFLLAEVPYDAALDENGEGLSDDFKEFLSTLSEICSNQKDCSLDIVATGRTYSGGMENLVPLKEKEVAFLGALETSLKEKGMTHKAIRKKGRVTVVDKMGGKDLYRVDINIYLVRERGK